MRPSRCRQYTLRCSDGSRWVRPRFAGGTTRRRHDGTTARLSARNHKEAQRARRPPRQPATIAGSARWRQRRPRPASVRS